MPQMSASTDQAPANTDMTAVPGKFRQQLTGFYNVYLSMKDAFVESDPEKVRITSMKVSEELGKIDMTLVDGDMHLTWMGLSNNMNSLIKGINSENEIEAQRKLFTSLNNFMYTAVKSFGLSGTTAYWEFCPMANDNKGAYWFSNSQEIRNPYFGDMMLTCGEVKEVVKD
jgi:Cu(I)/Ag(I) efflux system membrane fusion protein